MKQEDKKLMTEATKTLKSLMMLEDKDFVAALLNGKIEKEEHKEKHKNILDLINKLEDNK